MKNKKLSVSETVGTPLFQSEPNSFIGSINKYIYHLGLHFNSIHFVSKTIDKQEILRIEMTLALRPGIKSSEDRFMFPWDNNLSFNLYESTTNRAFLNRVVYRILKDNNFIKKLARIPVHYMDIV